MSGESWVRAWATIVTTGLGASLAASLLAGGSARAQAPVAAPSAPSAVVTTVDPCVSLELPHFRRLLSIELGTSIDYQPQAPREPGQTWVHLACAPGGVALQLQDGVTNKSMMRVLDTESIPPAERTRLLALAVAEFVVASWVELRVVPQPAMRAVGATEAPPPAVEQFVRAAVDRKLPPPPPRAAAESATEIALGAGLDTFTSHAGVLGTFSLRLVQATPPLAFLAGGDFGMMTVPVARQDVRVGTVDVLRASGIAALLVGGQLGPVSLWGGAGFRLGVIRMQGDSELSGLMEASFFDAHGGPLAIGRVTHRFGESLVIGLELELGAVTLPVEGTVRETTLLRFAELWLSAGLRVGFLF